jgi:hypothetical protein
MDKLFKPFSEKNYTKIVNEIGSLHYYIYDEGEFIPGNIFSKALKIQNYNCVVAGTGDTTESYIFETRGNENIVIPKNEQVIVVRLLRLDYAHGEPHYNADDQIIFPVHDGRIFRVTRRDAPDHYLKITATANIASVADAYRLPDIKYGPIQNYTENGASLHIKFVPVIA